MKPRPLILFVLLSGLILFNSFMAPGDKELAGITMPGHLMHEQEKLVLNGAGVRVKYWVKFYVCGLYVKKKSKDYLAVRNADENMAIRLHIVTSLVSAARMQQAIRDGFDQSTNHRTEAFQKEIDELIRVFGGDIKLNDVFEVKYAKTSGCSVFKNNVKKATIKGFAFKKALFGIWLGENPNHLTLRNELMGITTN